MVIYWQFLAGILVGLAWHFVPMVYGSWRMRQGRYRFVAETTMTLVQMARQRALGQDNWAKTLMKVSHQATADPACVAISACQILIEIVNSKDPLVWAAIEEQMEAHLAEVAKLDGQR